MNMLMRRLGLRSLVTAAFALGALVLSVALAVGTYLSARQSLIDQRERTGHAASLHRRGPRARRTVDPRRPSRATCSVPSRRRPAQCSTSTVVVSGTRASLDLPADGVTSVVRPAVQGGSVSLGWTDRTHPSSIVVGIPLPAVEAEYYEVAVAAELDNTLETLRIALGACAGITIAAGALLGRFASRRVLTPMTNVASAAAQISGGDLTTRLQDTQDPELVPLVAAFNNMVDALDARIQQDARFAADVAHELRTPLTTLTTSLSLLQKATDLSPRSEHAVTLMTAELRRFSRALEDLLTLGRLDSGTHERPASTIGPAELVRHALVSSGRDPALLAEPDDESRDAWITGRPVPAPPSADQPLRQRRHSRWRTCPMPCHRARRRGRHPRRGPRTGDRQ